MYLISRHYQRLLTTVNRNCGTVSSQRTFMSTMFGSDSADNKESPSMSSSTSQISGFLSKADIVEKIAEEHELSKAKSNRIVTQIFDTIAEVSFLCDTCLRHDILIFYSALRRILTQEVATFQFYRKWQITKKYQLVGLDIFKLLIRNKEMDGILALVKQS